MSVQRLLARSGSRSDVRLIVGRPSARLGDDFHPAGHRGTPASSRAALTHECPHDDVETWGRCQFDLGPVLTEVLVFGASLWHLSIAKPQAIGAQLLSRPTTLRLCQEMMPRVERLQFCSGWCMGFYKTIWKTPDAGDFRMKMFSHGNIRMLLAMSCPPFLYICPTADRFNWSNDLDSVHNIPFCSIESLEYPDFSK